MFKEYDKSVEVKICYEKSKNKESPIVIKLKVTSTGVTCSTIKEVRSMGKKTDKT